MTRELLLWIDGASGSAAEVPVTVELARAQGARLHIQVLTLVPYAELTAFVGVDADALRRAQRTLEDASAETLMAVNAALQAHDFAATVETRINGLSLLAEWAQTRARYTDLVVMGTQKRFSDPWCWTRLAEGVLFGSGRPLLLLPDDARPLAGWNHAVLGWNASREAIRALHDALPWLAPGARLDIVLFEPEQTLTGHGADPGVDIARTAARLGFASEVHVLPLPTSPLGDALQAFTAGRGADALILGAYGRSRLLEFVLGGATREVLEHVRVPVLLAH